MCVQVCPTGIDIRNGLQYECIGCAACVDACNIVMDKVEKPRGLIRYATENALASGMSMREMKQRILRPRVLGYAALLAVMVAALSTTLALRNPLKLDVIRDRGAMGREVEDGMIENVYRLQVMNTSEASHLFRINVSGIDSAAIVDEDLVELEGATTRAVPVRVRAAPGAGKRGSNKISFEVSALDDPRMKVAESAVFIVPK
jgi:cytochrome c oxidase accessory protein FixG